MSLSLNLFVSSKWSKSTKVCVVGIVQCNNDMFAGGGLLLSMLRMMNVDFKEKP